MELKRLIVSTRGLVSSYGVAGRYCDRVNVSVNPAGSEELPSKTECRVAAARKLVTGRTRSEFYAFYTELLVPSHVRRAGE